VGEQGVGLKRGAGTSTWPENARTWARPRRRIMGGRLGMTDRWARQDRERAGTGKRNGADRSTPQSSERERESALRLAPTGGARLSGIEGTRARLGWA
jgi:hypothetical protein